MSHLPLDARAILAYLNELGYRNISAEQLREFMKGMQPQSDINSNKQTSTTNQQSVPTTAATTGTVNQQHHKHHRFPKIIKGKKPLIHFKFYLDICDHQLTKAIEEKITALGGCLEFFLTQSITHFVTDKTICSNNNNNTNNNNHNNNNNINKPSRLENPRSPVTTTPYSREQSPCDSVKNAGSGTPSNGSGAAATKKQSRADAMLNKARRGTTNTTHQASVYDKTNNNNNNNNSNLSNSILSASTATQEPYIIWTTDYALRFFKRISQDLKNYLDNGGKKLNTEKTSRTVEPINLKGSFIKIEAIKRSQRPYYQLFRKPTEWPKIELNRDDGAFRLSPKRKQEPEDPPQEGTKMTRKSRSRLSQCQAAPKEASKKPIKKTCVNNIAVKSGNTNSTNAAVAGGVISKVKETSEKQCGVCEICKIEYDALTIHLKTKDHEYFAKNSQNFIALDTLIHASANVNNFLDANNQSNVKSEMEEEMEVVEEVASVETDVPDPLEEHERSNQTQLKRHSVATSYKTPSPTLREKSKRSTKGKHSSEKFQNVSAAKSARSASVSPQKKSCRTSSNRVELQKIKNDATHTPAAAPNRKKPKAPAINSSPIRAMLPPSSLYKVVENTSTLPRNCNTPPRKTYDGVADVAPSAIASPSLIVKFKKVRQTELLRLNGEAENFMFPRRRTSSDLPTDMDRQTTSENVLRTSMSLSSTSISLDSTSEHQMHSVFVDVENNETAAAMKAHTEVETKEKATVKRGKGRPIRGRSFPNAPIQPDEFTLKRIPGASLTASITLPEATRKSSRAATAIVTAATKSSRLLRAAVEAAKNSKRLSYDCSQIKCSTKMSETLSTCLPSATKSPGRKRTTVVVKLEDRMGDAEKEQDTDETDNDEDDDENMSDDDDEEDEDSDDEEEDDDDDEDYVSNFRCYNVNKKLLHRSKRTCTSNRVQKEASHEFETYIKQEVESSEETSKAKTRAKVKAKAKTKTKSKAKMVIKNKTLKASKTPIKKSSLPHTGFDVSKSEILPQLRFAFERVPISDPWYRVFTRQDAGEEQIFQYYGSTNYRKLPYELGPIPFNRTLDGICCKLCGHDEPVESSDRKGASVMKHTSIESGNYRNSIPLQMVPKVEEAATTTPNASSPTPCGKPSSSSKYTHKKLHLLQRYRREQQELLQKQQDADQQLIKNKPQPPKLETTVNAGQQPTSESKSRTPDREQYARRAGSTQSNTSSCASSTGTTLSKKFLRNKHLNKAAYLNLELPPRKSPREHASTLALVSCLIKQRQDSLSKPNSETDEPPTTPTVNCIDEEEEDILRRKSLQEIPPPPPPPPLPPPQLFSSDPLRSEAGTPIEELRFATEISENVKRLRRGQNKYDHSPTVVSSSLLSQRTCVRNTQRTKRALHGNAMLATKLKHRRRESSKYNSHNGKAPVKQGQVPSIRKTGCKKGVLEFEVDEAALEALETSKQYTNVRKLEWEIDKYIHLAGKDFDIDGLPFELGGNAKVEKTFFDDPKLFTTAPEEVNSTNTPPSTDYFSSDFDLCDLFTSTQNAGSPQDQNKKTKYNNSTFSLYSTVALQNYFRKRKNLKSNRTGWPKVQKKKASTRQREKLADKIRFLQEIGECPAEVGLLKVKEEIMEGDEDADESTDRKQQSGMITPPDTDDDEEDEMKTANDVEEFEVNDTELHGRESIKKEYDRDDLLAVDNPEADVEEDYEEATTMDSKQQVEMDRNDDAVYYQPATKRSRRCTAASPAGKQPSTKVATSSIAASTSTPCTQFLRSLRRSTPQLNGSLGSCVSPSEKAGDNSDIFTVSSDGLDTDLDQSNSHTTFLAKTGLEEQELHCVNHTPKRKFDLVAYAKSRSASASTKRSSCAIEAASAAGKSLAISEFLTKEVKVTCRRLRTPFRRFRYRR